MDMLRRVCKWVNLVENVMEHIMEEPLNVHWTRVQEYAPDPLHVANSLVDRGYFTTEKHGMPGCGLIPR